MKQKLTFLALAVLMFGLGSFVAPRVANALGLTLTTFAHTGAIAVPATGNPAIRLGVADQKSVVCQIPDGTVPCIRVGADSVTAASGLRYGDKANGCVGGQVIAMDAQNVYAVSEGVAVNVECGYGK